MMVAQFYSETCARLAQTCAFKGSLRKSNGGFLRVTGDLRNILRLEVNDFKGLRGAQVYFWPYYVGRLAQAQLDLRSFGCSSTRNVYLRSKPKRQWRRDIFKKGTAK